MDPIGLDITPTAYNYNQNTLDKELSKEVNRKIKKFYEGITLSGGIKLTHRNVITGLQKFHTELRPRIDDIFHKNENGGGYLLPIKYTLSGNFVEEKKEFKRHAFKDKTNCSGVKGVYKAIPNTNMSYCITNNDYKIDNSYKNGLANSLKGHFEEFTDTNLNDFKNGKTDLVASTLGKINMKEFFSIGKIGKNGLITIIVLFIVFFILRIILG